MITCKAILDTIGTTKSTCFATFPNGIDDLCNHSRIRLIRVFKGENDLAVEQKGEPLGPHVKTEIEKGAEDADDSVMEE
jgi:hypothetical protein